MERVREDLFLQKMVFPELLTLPLHPFYNPHEIIHLQRCSADEAPVDVGLGEEGVGVIGFHGAAVEEGDGVGVFLAKEG